MEFFALERRGQRPRITSIPASTSSVFAAESLPARAVKTDFSKAMIWETFATESLGRPVILDVRRTFPGASAHRRLLVSGTHTVVAIRLRFRASRPGDALSYTRHPARRRWSPRT